MSGDIPYDDPSLPGLSRYFNSSTIKGRANVALATYGTGFLILIYHKFIKKRPETKNMAGGEEANAAKLTGISKIFNGETVRGRANVAIATYASIALIIAYFKLKPKKAK